MDSDAASNKAVVLKLINCLLFLPFFTLIFSCKGLVNYQTKNLPIA